MKFTELGLDEDILRSISEQGYTEPTPVQAQAIPVILEGRDLMASAQTGTGKTAAFMLPVLQRIKRHASTSVSPARHPVRVLALTPTRELAVQVWESARDYAKYTSLRTTVVYGGVNIDPQIKELKAGVEILVSTPGRLLDHVQQKTVQLGQVEVLILDEADRMLDMGFMPDIKRILALMPAKRQNLMFSATFSDDIKRLANQILSDPARIQIAQKNTIAELVTHKAYKVGENRKRECLSFLLRSRELKQVLVFTSTRQMANRLAHFLDREGFSCGALHSDKSQAERLQALNEFKAGTINVLVATDIAARGLDIEQLPLVINYELPPNPEDYIHRVGRTGRAGLEGEAISLVSPNDAESLAGIEKMLKAPISIASESDLLRQSSVQAAAELPGAVSHEAALIATPPRPVRHVVEVPQGVRRKAQIPALFLPPAAQAK
ncbi:MAG: DEAD/DEAH box helicase [Burkholderiales bacterium]